jgi:hypothetical protein
LILIVDFAIVAKSSQVFGFGMMGIFFVVDGSR